MKTLTLILLSTFSLGALAQSYPQRAEYLLGKEVWSALSPQEKARVINELHDRDARMEAERLRYEAQTYNPNAGKDLAEFLKRKEAPQPVNIYQQGNRWMVPPPGSPAGF